jgi:hypothetical protein
MLTRILNLESFKSKITHQKPPASLTIKKFHTATPTHSDNNEHYWFLLLFSLWDELQHSVGQLSDDWMTDEYGLWME